MLQSFRSFFQSKWGVGFTLAFVGLIALAFASGDIVSTGGFGSVSSGSPVAKVGKDKIDAVAASIPARYAITYRTLETDLSTKG